MEKINRIYLGTGWIWFVICIFLFPALVTIVIIYKKTKNCNIKVWLLVQSRIMFFISYAETLFIKETGPRENHGNFAWGIYFLQACYMWFIWQNG